MFGIHVDSGYVPIADGISIKTLNYGSTTLMAEFRLERGARLPSHAHPHEQTGYLVSGRMRLSIGDATREIGPGDSWNVPSGVEHGAEVLDASVAIEVFSPLREDYVRFASPSEA